MSMIWWGPKRSTEKRTFKTGEFISGWENPAPEALRLARRAPGSTKPTPAAKPDDDGLKYVERP